MGGTVRHLARTGLVAAVVVAGGCAAMPGGPGEVGPALADDAAGANTDAPVTARPREADVPPRERWGTPFAVSASGQVTPLEPRRIIVVGSDPVIAAGLVEQRAIELRDRDDAPVATAPSSAGALAIGPGDRDVEVSPVRGGGQQSSSPLDTPLDDINTRTHLVQRGETWMSIAVRYGVSTGAMADANPGVDPQRVREGQQLMIPRESGARGPVVHRVVSGDTLSEIADRYNVSPAMIQRANGLTGDQIQVGQNLTIPVPGN